MANTINLLISELELTQEAAVAVAAAFKEDLERDLTSTIKWMKETLSKSLENNKEEETVFEDKYLFGEEACFFIE